jgi:hypothetical protein
MYEQLHCLSTTVRKLIYSVLIWTIFLDIIIIVIMLLFLQ